jgi:SagB-type dehydrogenase family enzyme
MQLILRCVVFSACLFPLSIVSPSAEEKFMSDFDSIRLPGPDRRGRVSVEETIAQRRSVRQYRPGPLALADVAQLLWAGQGITDPRGYRSAPSAGALYPLEIDVVAGDVEQVPPGVYRYVPRDHALVRRRTGDLREELSAAGLNQAALKRAPAVLVISGVYERTTGKYGERGMRYVHMEAGHAAQNICLQAVALDLATVPIGAFRDTQVQSTLGLAGDEQPLYLVPVGKPQ